MYTYIQQKKLIQYLVTFSFRYLQKKFRQLTTFNGNAKHSFDLNNYAIEQYEHM